MSLTLNGLPSPSALGMHPGAFRNAIARTAEPAHVGYGMVLGARTHPAYAGTVSHAEKTRRRAKGKAARQARATHRKAAR